jgi:hypothetical protein
MLRLSVCLLVETVLRFTDIATLGNLSCTSTYLRQAADNQGLWRRLYLGRRAKHFCITSNSVHEGIRRFHTCAQNRRNYWYTATQYSPAVRAWENAGAPCNVLSHYSHDTLLEDNKKACKYRYYKRAVAKMMRARMPTFTAHRTLDKLKRQRAILDDDIAAMEKQRDARGHFAAILSLPPRTPPHLKKARRVAR